MSVINNIPEEVGKAPGLKEVNSKEGAIRRRLYTVRCIRGQNLLPHRHSTKLSYLQLYVGGLPIFFVNIFVQGY